MEQEFGVFHKHIHTKLREKYNEGDILGWGEIKLYLNKYNVPTECCFKFIREMEELSLVKKLNQRKIQIL